MLDFLLVLGQIPGTNFQVTFNELFGAFLVCSAIYEYRLRRKAIRRFARWAWYRTCVNYRRRRRMLRTYINTKRYRLAVFERRIKRNIRTAVHRRQRAIAHFSYKTKRKSQKSARKIYLAFIDQTLGRYRRFLRSLAKAIYRSRRAASNYTHRKISLIKRSYYIRQVRLERFGRRAKRSRAFQSILTIKNFVSQSV